MSTLENQIAAPSSIVEKSARQGLLKRGQYFLLALAAVPLLIALLAYFTSAQQTEFEAGALAADRLLLSLDDLFSSLQDAETGQRGYILTGSSLYLTPYIHAKSEVSSRLAAAAGLARKAGVQAQVWNSLNSAVAQKMEELDLTLKLQNSGQRAAALAEIRTDRGKQLMDRIRQQIADLKAGQTETFQTLYARQLASEKRLRIALGLGVIISVVLFAAAFRLIVLYARERDQVENEILGLYEKLEIRVQERTAELQERTSESEAQARALERTNSDLAQFAFIASHDLQEPLRMVASYMALLARKYGPSLDETAHTYIRFATDGAARMQTLINDLLDYSRSGTQALSKKRVPFASIVEQAIANLEVTIQESSALVNYAALPVVYVDELKMLQVVQNLLNNAIKFRREGIAPEIFIRVERKGSDLLFSVSDNGIGFDPKYGDLIFEAFQRLHGMGKYPGNGIGLSICRRIVEHHGGRLWADSKPGFGSTFFFTLPDPP